MALDLTEATLDAAGASLELDTTMEGIEVRVPAYGRGRHVVITPYTRDRTPLTPGPVEGGSPVH